MAVGGNLCMEIFRAWEWDIWAIKMCYKGIEGGFIVKLEFLSRYNL